MIDAITNRELSPSQLSTFELCPRKWAWAKIEGIKGPSSPSAQFGTDVHEHLELYLRDGKPIDLSNGTGQLALAMLPYAPQPGTAAIEEWFYFDFWGHRLRGKKDAENDTVFDWKTTSDLMWAKSACPADAGTKTILVKDQEETVCARCGGPVDRVGRCEKALVNDIAACVYATDAMLKSGLDYARLRWVYGVRKKPYRTVRLVEATLTREAVTPTLARVKKLADEITSIPRGTRALDLPYDMNACSAFGGCPYVGLCNLSPEETMRSAMNQDLEAQKQAFYAHAEKLKQQQGGFGYAVNPPQQPMQGQSMQQPPQGFQGPPQFTPPPNGQQFQGGPPPGQFSGPPQGGFAPPPGQGAPPGFQQPGGPPQGGFSAPPGQQAPQGYQGAQQQFQAPQTVNGTPAHPGWAPPQGAPQFQGPPQGQGAPPSFQQPGNGAPQFQAPGGAPPAEPARAGRPKGSKNKNKAPTTAGEPSYAMAYRLIAQGNEMLAQLSATEEDE